MSKPAKKAAPKKVVVKKATKKEVAAIVAAEPSERSKASDHLMDEDAQLATHSRAVRGF